MAEVVVYTRSLCGFCSAVKNLLNTKNIKFKELDGTFDTEVRKEMMTRSGRNTFPQIFVDGKHIGDCDEVHRLDDEGKLDAILA